MSKIEINFEKKELDQNRFQYEVNYNPDDMKDLCMIMLSDVYLRELVMMTAAIIISEDSEKMDELTKNVEKYSEQIN